MIALEIKGSAFNLCSDWNDLTLLKFQQICKLSIPAKLKQRWLALLKQDDKGYQANESGIKQRDIIKSFPIYYGEVLKICSDIPAEMIDRIEWSLREQLFNSYLFKFAVTTLSDIPLEMIEGKLEVYKSKGSESFIFAGQEFFLPESLDYGGRNIPMYKETILTFSESSDIEIALHEWGEKGISAMAQIMAVYCRKKDDVYSDDLVIERTKLFEKADMQSVWEVFFCIAKLGILSMRDMLIFLQAQSLKSLPQPTSQD